MPHKDPVAKKDYHERWAMDNRDSVLASNKRYNKKRQGLPGTPEREAYNEAQRGHARRARLRKARRLAAAALVAKAAVLAKEALAARARGYGGQLNPGRL